jgi:hypothetical protein
MAALLPGAVAKVGRLPAAIPARCLFTAAQWDEECRRPISFGRPSGLCARTWRGSSLVSFHKKCAVQAQPLLCRILRRSVRQEHQALHTALRLFPAVPLAASPWARTGPSRLRGPNLRTPLKFARRFSTSPERASPYPKGSGIRGLCARPSLSDPVGASLVIWEESSQGWPCLIAQA